jgi:CubicO group peptidase (beta-lactamase class C family)
MFKSNLATSKRVRGLLDEYRGQGLMTHAYAAWGHLDRVSDFEKIEILPDGRNVFDLASITKAVVTTPLIYQEIMDGNISLKTTVLDWMRAEYPRRLIPFYRNLKIENLLSHQAQLPAWSNFWVNIWDNQGQKKSQREIPALTPIELHLQGLNRVAITSENKKDREIYSDIGFMLLGLLISLKKKRTLASLFHGLLKEINVSSDVTGGLFFSPSLFIRDQCIPTSFCYLRKRLLLGEVHDENCAALGGESGHAGLFGTGDGLRKFLFNFCSSDLGKSLMKENWERSQSRTQNLELKRPILGWRLDETVFFKRNIALGHLGFTGGAFWVLPSQNFFAILLTNRVISGRISQSIKKLRGEFAEVIENSL